MTTKRDRWLSSILDRVPNTAPPDDEDAGNVVPFQRATLDDMEKRLHAHEGAVIDAQAAMHRAAMAYVERRKDLIAYRKLMAERMAENGAQISWPFTPPAIDIEGLKISPDDEG